MTRLKHKEKSGYLNVYYTARGTAEIRAGMPDFSRPISAEHLAELAYQLGKIAAEATKPLVSRTTDVHYTWLEFK